MRRKNDRRNKCHPPIGVGEDLGKNDDDNPNDDRCDQTHFDEDAQQEPRPLVHADNGALSLRFARPALSRTVSRPAGQIRRSGEKNSSDNVSTETRVQRELQRILADTDSFSSFNAASFSEDDPLFALKVVQIRSEHQIHSLAEEIRILHALRGEKHVVQLLAAELDIQSFEGVMLLELAACDLRQVLEKKKRVSATHRGDFPLIGDLFLQACLAVQSVHSRGILHFDLKPENFLCFEEGGAGGDHTSPKNGIVIKLADFGVSAQMTTCQTHITRETPVGSIKYMAPETIFQQQGATYDNEASMERSWVGWGLGDLKLFLCWCCDQGLSLLS